MSLRRVTFALLAAGLVSGGSAMAQEWWGEDPYWSATLSELSGPAPVARSDDFLGRPIVETSPIAGFGRFDPIHDLWLDVHPADAPLVLAQRPGETLIDAGAEARDPWTPHGTGAQLVRETESARRQLERAGFTQYAP